MDNATLPALDTRTVKDYTLFPNPIEDTYPEDYSQEKADKMSAVLGDTSPGTAPLQADVMNGAQRQWLDVIKNQEDNANLQRRNEILQDVFQKRDPSFPITQDEISVVKNLSNDELYSSDVDTILEKKYADLYTNLLSTNEESVVAKDALEESPDQTMDVMDRAQFPMMRNQIVQDVLQSTKAKYDAESWGSWGVDIAKSMIIPGYDTLKNRERVQTPTGSLLLGNNMEEQVSQLYSMPPAQFKETLKNTVDELAKDNVVAAMQYIIAVQSYGQTDKGMGNLSLPFDIAGAAGSVASVAKFAKGLSTMAKAITLAPRNISKIASTAGFNKTAAISTVTKDLLAGDLSGATTVRRLEELGDRLPTLMDPQKVLDGSTRMSAEAEQRIREVILQNGESVLAAMGEGTGIDRLEPSQMVRAVTEAQEKVIDTFQSTSHNIIDSIVIPASEDKITNTAVLETRFGKRDGTFFQSEASAKSFAKRYIGLKTNDYTIEQKDLGGYYIAVRKPIADVGDWRKATIETEIQSPNTFDGVFSRSLRSPDYFLSISNTQARGRVVHTGEHFSNVVGELTKPFNGKSKEWYSEMDSMFRKSRTREKYFQTTQEFEDAFYKQYQKVPEESQYEAYFLYRQLHELDYMIRDADKVKKYTSKGFSNFSMMKTSDEGEAADKFIGRTVDQLPPTDRPYNIEIVQKGQKVKKINSFSRNWSQNKDQIDDLLSKGYKIIEHGETPTYTIAKDFQNDSIKMKTLGYKEGGHFEPRYDFYISQGKFDKIDQAKIFKGDQNFATAVTEKQAREIAAVFDEARLKVKNNAPDAGKFIEDNLPISYDQFMRKVQSGLIDLDAPVLARRAGQDTTDTFKYESIFPNFQNYKHSEYNPLADTSVKFGTERADTTLDVWANEDGKFVYKTNYESLLSPMDALASASRSMINVRTFEDYAMKSANDWVQEFGHLLDVPTETLKSNPRYYLQNPVYKTLVGKDKAEASRMAMLSLFNQLDVADASRTVAKDKMLSKMYDLGGEKLRAFADEKMYTAKDVQTFMRGAAFNLKLGFWNPKHLFLQSSQIMPIVAISPRAGFDGLRAMPLMRLAVMNGNKDVLNGLWNRFGKLSGWDKNEFFEMVKSFKQSGLADIGGDLSYLDRMDSPSIGGKFPTASKAVKSNTFFFEEGERASRIVAYAAAYREWKAANPKAILDRFGENRILQRAKDMTTNMTRDSNAKWQKGWAGVMTQFMSYQARVAEQMWDGGLFSDGKKLSKAEKLRLYGMMSTLYGGGTALSMGTVFIPTAQVIRQWMSDTGVDPDSPGMDVFINGAPHALMKSILGADVDFSTYGPTGLSTIYDLMNEDKSWADVALGAGPGVVGDLYNSGASLAGTRIALGYEAGSLTQSDLLSVFRNIATVDNATKAWVAMNTGKWISKNGNYVSDVNSTEALMSAILGVQPMSVSDTYLQMKSNKGYLNARKEGLREYEKAATAATRALSAGDQESYLIYRKRRDALGILYDLTLSEQAAVARRTLFDTPLSEDVANSAADIERKYKTFSDKQREKK